MGNIRKVRSVQYALGFASIASTAAMFVRIGDDGAKHHRRIEIQVAMRRHQLEIVEGVRHAEMCNDDGEVRMPFEHRFDPR